MPWFYTGEYRLILAFFSLLILIMRYIFLALSNDEIELPKNILQSFTKRAHLISYTMQHWKIASLRCGCYEGELIHRFGSSFHDRTQGSDTSLPRNSLSVALNHSEDRVPRIDSRMLCDMRPPDARKRQPFAVRCCMHRRAKRTRGEASSLSRSQRHRSRDQIGHLGPAVGLQSDIRRRYCVCTPCSPIT